MKTMMPWPALIAALILLGSTIAHGATAPEPDHLIENRRSGPPTSIAFGSCNRHTDDQEFWRTIGDVDADLWLSLGDNIYADNVSPERRWEAYQALLSAPAYADFIASTPVAATWDDHDYAYDNAGGDYADKIGSQSVFLDFLGIQADHQLRDREGVYNHTRISQGGRTIDVLLMDTRYFKDITADDELLLGAAQWAWLEDRILNSPADLIVLGSSVHVSSEVVGFALEGWKEYPQARNRLFELIRNAAAPVIMVSGDRHAAEFSGYPLSRDEELIEVTSSGLTHAIRWPTPNRHRIGRLHQVRNFGVIEFDWQAESVDVTFTLRRPQNGSTIATLERSYSLEK